MTARQLARRAAKILGRRYKRQAWLDWPAIEAVKKAAVEAGLDQQLWHWVPHVQDVKSLTQLAEAFLCRYTEAYGLGATAPGAHQALAERQVLVSIERCS